MTRPGPSVEPTPASAIVLAGVVSAGLAWVGLSAVESFGWPVPPVPWLTGVVIGVLALSAWLGARWMHRTVQVRRERVDPARAVALLLAGKAALLGGAHELSPDAICDRLLDSLSDAPEDDVALLVLRLQ